MLSVIMPSVVAPKALGIDQTVAVNNQSEGSYSQNFLRSSYWQ